MNPALTILNRLIDRADPTHVDRMQQIFQQLIIPVSGLVEGADVAQSRKGCLAICFISEPGDRPDHERGELYHIQFGKVLPLNMMFAGEKIARCAAEDVDVSSISAHAPLASYAPIPFHALKGFQFAGCVRILNPDHSYTYVSTSGLNQFADELVSVVLQKMIFDNDVFTGALSDIAQEHLARALKIGEDCKGLFVF